MSVQNLSTTPAGQYQRQGRCNVNLCIVFILLGYFMPVRMAVKQPLAIDSSVK